MRYITTKLAQLSKQRQSIINGTLVASSESIEESKESDLVATFESLASGQLATLYFEELKTVFEKNRGIEAEMKAKASAQEDGAADKKKKKQAPTALQFGAGVRKFFDYLLLILSD